MTKERAEDWLYICNMLKFSDPEILYSEQDGDCAIKVRAGGIFPDEAILAEWLRRMMTQFIETVNRMEKGEMFEEIFKEKAGKLLQMKQNNEKDVRQN